MQRRHATPLLQHSDNPPSNAASHFIASTSISATKSKVVKDPATPQCVKACCDKQHQRQDDSQSAYHWGWSASGICQCTGFRQRNTSKHKHIQLCGKLQHNPAATTSTKRRGHEMPISHPYDLEGRARLQTVVTKASIGEVRCNVHLIGDMCSYAKLNATDPPRDCGPRLHFADSGHTQRMVCEHCRRVANDIMLTLNVPGQ